MRFLSIAAVLASACQLGAAELESRVLTHYIPQDFLETAVRTEGWTEVTLKVAGGLRKGDIVRIWTGGTIDRGNGEQPGQNVNGPVGVAETAAAANNLALAKAKDQVFALLFKTESPILRKAAVAGKPLE